MPVLLVVDDDELVLESLEATFEEDFQVHKAGSAERAREIVAEHRIDVVISDDRLPRETGVEFLGWLAEEQPRAIRILLTGYFSEPGDVVRSIRQGRVWHYMRKPWEAGAMSNIIERALESQRREEALQSAEARYRQLFASIPVGLFECDAAGNLLTWNEAFSSSLGGWPAGRPSLASRLPPESWDELVSTRDADGRSAPRILQLNCFDGRSRAVRVQLVHGDRPGVLRGTIHEVSAASPAQGLDPVVQPLYNASLVGQSYRAALLQTRNQLGVLGGNLEILLQDLGPREEIEEMGQALAQANAVNRAAAQLEGPWSRQGPCAAEAVCERVLQGLEALVPHLPVSKSLGLGDAQVGLSENRLRELFNGVLHYALCVGEATRPLEFGTQRAEGRARIWLYDRGADLGPAVTQALFESPYEYGEGRGGFGLRLSRLGAREVGGELRVEHPSEGGVRFLLELPLLEG